MARNSGEREKFLAILATTPLIVHACKKVGISRATIYRWIKDDYAFKREVLKAMERGREGLVEMAEAVLVSKIRAGDMGAIKFFLAHNSKRYQAKAVPDMTNLEKKDPFSAFRGPDGSIRISEQTAAMIEKEDKDKERRKSRAMGYPDD